MSNTTSKTNPGHFFEDFTVGQHLVHATPRTVTAGDVALYNGLYGARFAVQSSDAFAQSIGYDQAPVDDLLVFHVVFGKTVPDISLNAVANLGYADCVFGVPVFVGDSLRAESDVIGLKENSNGKTGVVYVRTRGLNQRDETVLDYVRWVMVHKRDPASKAPAPVVPELASAVSAGSLPGGGLERLAAHKIAAYNHELGGSPWRFADYAVGEKINHVDGVTLEEAEHQIATRLYQNTAKVHFNAFEQKDSRFGRRLIYGGVVISLVRALSFNGLENCFKILAINGGRHVAPVFAGDTVYAWSEVIERASLSAAPGFGAIRLRTIGLKNRTPDGYPLADAAGATVSDVVLDLDYWIALPA